MELINEIRAYLDSNFDNTDNDELKRRLHRAINAFNLPLNIDCDLDSMLIDADGEIIRV